MEKDHTNDLLELSRNLGAILAGVADFKNLISLVTYPDDLLKNYKYAISIAVSIPPPIIDSITVESPGEIYAHFYKTSNSFSLDFLEIQSSFIEPEPISKPVIMYGFAMFYFKYLFCFFSINFP